MNLHDLLRRKDRALSIESGSVEACELKRVGGGMRGVRFGAPGSTLVINGAHRASSLLTFPGLIGWCVSGPTDSVLHVEIRAGGTAFPLAVVHIVESREMPVLLRWPIPVPAEYDLVIRTGGDGVVIVVGPLFDSRARVLPAIVGTGIEVGPGLNPTVLPGEDVKVSYVEQKHPIDWAKTYAKREFSDDEMKLWDHYVVDSAARLDNFDDESIDFVFSSHVVEHLVDPLGVFGRWWKKLKSNGIIAGVVPDARFTFDWRQPLEKFSEIEAQRGFAGTQPTDEMYARWCRYTAPDSTPESMKSREYSVHVNYFTPSLFRDLLQQCVDDLGPARIFIHAVDNGKDFAFLLQKEPE